METYQWLMLIALGIVKNQNIEKIRSQAPTSQLSRDMGTVQRLNDNGCERLTVSMIAQDIV